MGIAYTPNPMLQCYFYIILYRNVKNFFIKKAHDFWNYGQSELNWANSQIPQTFRQWIQIIIFRRNIFYIDCSINIMRTRIKYFSLFVKHMHNIWESFIKSIFIQMFDLIGPNCSSSSKRSVNFINNFTYSFSFLRKLLFGIASSQKGPFVISNSGVNVLLKWFIRLNIFLFWKIIELTLYFWLCAALLTILYKLLNL